MNSMDAILKLRHQLKESIDHQEDALVILTQIFANADPDEVVSEIIDKEGEVLTPIATSFEYSCSDAIHNCGYNISHAAGAEALIVEQMIKDASAGDQLIHVELNLAENTPNEMIDALRDSGIECFNMLQAISDGMQLNQTVSSVNEAFLTSEKIALDDLHNKLEVSQQLLTDDQRSLYLQLGQNAMDGKVHKTVWLSYISQVINKSAAASDNQSFYLDTTDPFPKATFMNTVWNVIKATMSLVFTALAIIFRSLAFVFSAVTSLLSNLIQMYDHYDEEVTVNDENFTGRITGPIIASGYKGGNTLSIAQDGHLHRYILPGLELLTWANMNDEAASWNETQFFINAYVNCNVDPAKLRNYLFNNIRLVISDDPDQPGHKIGHIRPIKKLFNQFDPEWINVYQNDQYSDVQIDTNDLYAMCCDPKLVKVLTGVAITCALLGFGSIDVDTKIFDVETQFQSNYDDRADMNHVDIIDDNDNIITVTDTPSLGNGSYKISRIWPGVSSDTENYIAGLGNWYPWNEPASVNLPMKNALMVNGLNNIIKLLCYWQVTNHDGVTNDDILTKDVTTLVGTRKLVDYLTFLQPDGQASSLKAMRSSLLDCFQSVYDVSGIPISGTYCAINKSAPVYFSDTNASFSYFGSPIWLELINGRTFINHELLSPWNVLDEQITGDQFSLPDPGVKALVQAATVALVAIATALIAVKIAKMKFTKWSRMKQVKAHEKLTAAKKAATDPTLSKDQHIEAVAKYNKAIFRYELSAKIFRWGSYDAANDWINSPGDSGGTALSNDNLNVLDKMLNTNNHDVERTTLDVYEAITGSR